MYRHIFYPYKDINFNLFNGIFSIFNREINNISLFFKTTRKESGSFAKIFSRKLVNIVDKGFVSAWPGTISTHRKTLSVSCVYNKRTKYIFLNRIVPFLFGVNKDKSDINDNENCFIETAIRHTSYSLLYNSSEKPNENLYENINIDYLRFQNDCDCSIINNEGIALFSTIAHEKICSLCIPMLQEKNFFSVLHLDESILIETEIFDNSSEEFRKFFMYRTFQRHNRKRKLE